MAACSPIMYHILLSLIFASSVRPMVNCFRHFGPYQPAFPHAAGGNARFSGASARSCRRLARPESLSGRDHIAGKRVLQDDIIGQNEDFMQQDKYIGAVD